MGRLAADTGKRDWDELIAEVVSIFLFLFSTSATKSGRVDDSLNQIDWCDARE
jgi:hypothetical protein